MKTEKVAVTAETISRFVEFDSPFLVHDDGKHISREDSVYGPELLIGNDIQEDKKKLTVPFPGYPQWELVSGFSGQDSYPGPVMHDSEFLGGGMARWVMENPGIYVMTSVMWDDESDPGLPMIQGWALSHLVDNKKDRA